jgi:hypothetical protein
MGQTAEKVCRARQYRSARSRTGHYLVTAREYVSGGKGAGVAEHEHAHHEWPSAGRRLTRWFLEQVEHAVSEACDILGHREGCGHGEGGHGEGGHGRPVKPVPPGQAAPPVTVPAAAAARLTTAALGSAYAVAGQPAPAQVVWHDSDGEVLVHLGLTAVEMFPGLILVALTLETDETGPGQLVVPFAVGSTDSPAGLLAVTEQRPRGPVPLADRWGEAATAAAWQAVLDVAHGLALQSGVDTAGARLIPGAISADGSSLSVVPQARQVSDQVAGR